MPKLAPGKRACDVGPRVAVALALLATSSSCVRFASELDTAEDDAAEEESAVTLAARADDDADWSCLGGSRPLAASSAARNLTFSFTVRDFVTRAPVGGVSVRACFSADLACVSPATAPDVPSSGEDGRVDVTVAQGFEGYLELTGASMIATLMFFATPWSERLLAVLEADPVLLFPAPTIAAYGDLAPPAVSASTGGIGVLTQDCTGAAAAGVRLDIDSEGVPISFVDGLPVGQDFTNDDGLGGFGLVPPGVVVLKELLRDQDDPIAAKSLLVRPGWFTIITLIPGLTP
jgi:hypothetical protein